jgi:hypothetical protein
MSSITINVPVVYMAWDIMILVRENPFRGPLEGVGPENRDFWGPEMATSEASAIWAESAGIPFMFTLHGIFNTQ